MILFVLLLITIITIGTVAFAIWFVATHDSQNVENSRYTITLNLNNGESNIVYNDLELNSYIYLPYASKDGEYFNGWKQNTTYYKGANNELAFEIQVSTIKGDSSGYEFTLTAEYVAVPTGYVLFKVFDGVNLIKQTLVETSETKFYVFNLNTPTEKSTNTLTGYTTTSIKHYNYFNEEVVSTSIELNDYFNINELVTNNSSLTTIELYAVYE